MEQINSYPSVMQIGHKMIADIFSGEVIVEEKIDGSQFSFGVINGELTCRSKGKQQILEKKRLYTCCFLWCQRKIYPCKNKRKYDNYCNVHKIKEIKENNETKIIKL